MLPLNKRWRDRDQRWVAPGELFSPSNCTVDVIDHDTAKPFTEQHHYSGTFPASRLSCGLFRGTHLMGVAVFSVPMHQGVLPHWTGLSPDEGTELGRFVCLPEVQYNGETWFLARALRLLRQEKPGIRAVLSYADPLERTAGALVVKPAHYGTIYQASNALYAGRSSTRTLYLANGKPVNGRALTKIRKQEQGHEYASRQLVALGAPPRRFGESPAAWVRRALASFQRVKHPGNLAYLFGLDDEVVAQLRAKHQPRLPYVKKIA